MNPSYMGVKEFLISYEAAITSLKEKVDNLKTSLNGEIIGREADKRIYSAKEINELKTIVDEMMSTMLDLAAAIADLKHESLQPKESNESAQVRITDLAMITVSKEEHYIVIIFLIAVLIGLNLQPNCVLTSGTIMNGINWFVMGERIGENENKVVSYEILFNWNLDNDVA
ncbi:hypothetical protein HKD37_07G020559 [Glycine soja]